MMCSARSLSPNLNQSSNPNLAACLSKLNVSPCTPQPFLASNVFERAYNMVSISGQMYRLCKVILSPIFTMIVSSSEVIFEIPLTNFADPVPPANIVIRRSPPKLSK